MEHVEVVVGFFAGMSAGALALALVSWRRASRALVRVSADRAVHAGARRATGAAGADEALRALEGRASARARELENLVTRGEEVLHKLRAARDDAKRGSSAAPGAGAPASDAATERSERRAEILSLHDSGLSAIAISQAVGIQRGEVELILSLEGERPSGFRRSPRNQPLR